MKRYAIALFAAAALITGCGSDDSTFFNGTVNPIINIPNPPTPVGFKQIEILARPGINEALLFTNAFLNAYNSVTPPQAAAVLSDGTNPITQEAVGTLNAITGFIPGQGLNSGLLDTAGAVAALIPDVMRIDSTLDAIPATTGQAALATGAGIGTQPAGTVINPTIPTYNQAFLNNVNSPYAGRKLTDDVIDFTYLALLGPVTDHVNYAGNANNPATGHQPILNAFPYLAPAN